MEYRPVILLDKEGRNHELGNRFLGKFIIYQKGSTMGLFGQDQEEAHAHALETIRGLYQDSEIKALNGGRIVSNHKWIKAYDYSGDFGEFDPVVVRRFLEDYVQEQGKDLEVRVE